ncbi:ATP-dependent DEAD box helicase [Plasmodium gonderi]|uniref:ATP-dependent DEAD box helicase n=1 Tax=Plasmodium gonderi TaxID=77519 RepID=A0A1Y1JN21_PLAGO|nr:ATP-dependent DEAD box helicase [Plasmodium gonderi]GAW81793.1 ATP-dependent DEAD box helicase [Plasmodium gonderi]
MLKCFVLICRKEREVESGAQRCWNFINAGKVRVLSVTSKKCSGGIQTCGKVEATSLHSEKIQMESNPRENCVKKINEEYRKVQQLIPLHDNELQKIRNVLIRVINDNELLHHIVHTYKIPSFFLLDNDVRNHFLQYLIENTSHSYDLREFLLNVERNETKKETRDCFSHMVSSEEKEISEMSQERRSTFKECMMPYEKVLNIFLSFIKKYYYKQWIFYEHVKRICDFSELSTLVKNKKKGRKLHLYIGPTNSGKTYEAFKKLCKSNNGLYCAPLRLLAWEIHKKLIKLNKVTNLLTGQEIIEKKNPSHTVCTIEMTPLNRNYDCVLIDEIQMISNDTRGYSWTNVLLNVNCEEIYLCGSENVVNLIKNLSDLLHDELIIKRFKRLTKLHVQENTEDLKNLKTGDCVITFSRNNIMLLKHRLEGMNKRVFIIYGSLPPESKKKQIELFNWYCTEENKTVEVGAGGEVEEGEVEEGEVEEEEVEEEEVEKEEVEKEEVEDDREERMRLQDHRGKYSRLSKSKKETILIATDVIGMGVNINIKRIIFYSLQKFDGYKLRYLSISEVLQISGRAGRFYQESTEPINGYVTCVHSHDLHIVKRIFRGENIGAPIESSVEKDDIGNLSTDMMAQREGKNNTCADVQDNWNNPYVDTSHILQSKNEKVLQDVVTKLNGNRNSFFDTETLSVRIDPPQLGSIRGDNSADSFFNLKERKDSFTRAGYFPDFNMIDKLKKLLEFEHKAKIELHEILQILVDYVKINDVYFFLTKNYNQMVFIAKFLKNSKLDTKILFAYTLSPININNVNMLTALKTFAMCHEILGFVDFFQCISRDMVVIPTNEVEGVKGAENIKGELSNLDLLTSGLLFHGNTINGEATNGITDGVRNEISGKLRNEVLWGKHHTAGMEEPRSCSFFPSSNYIQELMEKNTGCLNFPLDTNVLFSLPEDKSVTHRIVPQDLNPPNIGFYEYISVLEVYYEIIDLYCWLHTKFPKIYTNIDSVNDEKKRVSNAIIHILTKSLKEVKQ